MDIGVTMLLFRNIETLREDDMYGDRYYHYPKTASRGSSEAVKNAVDSAIYNTFMISKLLKTVVCIIFF